MQHTRQQPEYQFDLSGGNLCLDFANTVSWRGNPERRKERLDSYVDLAAFARQSGVLSPKQASELNSWGREHSPLARRSFRKAITLRESLYRAFLAIAQEKAPAVEDLRAINDSAVEAFQHRTLARENAKYRWQWLADAKNPIDRILWPVAESAAELLTSDEMRKTVHWCEAPDCEWLFLDKSRNRSRRWCDMTVCGNRQKARRHYQRAHD